jgi:predicted peptidase
VHALLLLLLPVLASAAPLTGSDFETFTAADGTSLQYVLRLPNDHDPSEAYPAVLALPPGGQDRAMVAEGIGPWQAAFAADGWIVVSPAAPDEGMFSGAAHRHLAPLMDSVAARHKIDGRFHLFGISNGGRSAFTAALAWPERFASMVVMPGVPSTEQEADLSPLEDLPITLVVGSKDGGWTRGSRRVHKTLKALGGPAELVEIKGADHFAFRAVSWDDLRGWLARRAATP